MPRIFDERLQEALDAARRWPTLQHALPGTLRGPGTIASPSITSCELIAASGVRYRVHCRDGLGGTWAATDYPRAEIVDEHPVLVHVNQPSRSLYFKGTPRDLEAVLVDLEGAIRAASDGWRGVADYVRDAGAALSAGHGELMMAPDPVCAAVATALERVGVETSILGGGGRPRRYRALVLGRSYLIAGGFGFEPRP